MLKTKRHIENFIRVYAKKKEKCSEINEAFQSLCSKNGLEANLTFSPWAIKKKEGTELNTRVVSTATKR